jgi:hypothetical protein
MLLSSYYFSFLKLQPFVTDYSVTTDSPISYIIVYHIWYSNLAWLTNTVNTDFTAAWTRLLTCILSLALCAPTKLVHSKTKNSLSRQHAPSTLTCLTDSFQDWLLLADNILPSRSKSCGICSVEQRFVELKQNQNFS